MNHASGNVNRQITRELTAVHTQTTAETKARIRKEAGAPCRGSRSSHKAGLLAT
jgi:hypothetical protein